MNLLIGWGSRIGCAVPFGSIYFFLGGETILLGRLFFMFTFNILTVLMIQEEREFYQRVNVFLMNHNKRGLFTRMGGSG